MMKVALHNLGCKVNAYETEAMQELLEQNGYEIVPIGWYRDQGNLGNYGQYGYGVMVYRLNMNQVNTTGANTLVLNKKNPTPAVYPSTLVYMYDAPGGSLKDVELVLGADLLANDYNKAGRVIMMNSQINVSMADVTDAKLYVGNEPLLNE